jgi:hypothetical protein
MEDGILIKNPWIINEKRGVNRHNHQRDEEAGTSDIKRKLQ